MSHIGWPLVELRHLTKKIGSGATPTGGKGAYLSSGIPLIRSMNVHDLQFDEDELAFIDERQAKKLDNVTTEPGDVLLNITGASVARCCMLPARFAGGRVNQHVAILRADPDKLDGTYLSYVLVSAGFKGQLLSIAGAGATREALTKGSLERFAVPTPPLETQRRIAAILGALDDLIEVNRRRVAVLEEMARGLFEEWFVRFRFPGHETYPILDTPDGPLPEGWRWENLYDAAEVSFGFAFKSKAFTTERVGVPVVRIRDVLEGRTSTWTPEAFDDRYWVKNGDLLIGMDGIFHTNIWVGGDAALNQRVTRLRPKDGLSVGWLFRGVLPKIKFFEATISGTTVAHLGAKHLKTIMLPRADEATQRRADAFFAPIDAQLVNLKVANERLAASRDLLLPRLISGQLSIEAAERELEAAA